MSKKQLQKIPGVDLFLEQPAIKNLKKIYTSEFITYSIRHVLNDIRSQYKKGIQIPALDEIVDKVINVVNEISAKSLKKVINATGVVLHTNLGRAPLGTKVLNELEPAIIGYSNLEFDLDTGKRGNRTDHVIELLKFLTGAEDTVVVNNNAAAVSLVLKTLAEGKEVIISRGELIEIGGSFRLPEIMEASGAKMIEVGTTNRTRLSDYEKSINKNTSIILKVHKSNYAIEGFTKEINLKELSTLTKMNKLILMHDIGSGLLIDPARPILQQEPVVKMSIKAGADVVTFSCDKLLGGPQAGIIAGKRKLVRKIANSPLMRTYRVDKLTIAMLSKVLRSYINLEDRMNLPIFKFLDRSENELKSLAEGLLKEFSNHQIEAKICKSEAFSGGGSLPQVRLDSYSVVLISPDGDKSFAKDVFQKLLKTKIPVLGVLRKGELHFDVLTVFDDEISLIGKMVRSVI